MCSRNLRYLGLLLLHRRHRCHDSERLRLRLQRVLSALGCLRRLRGSPTAEMQLPLPLLGGEEPVQARQLVQLVWPTSSWWMTTPPTAA